MATAVSLSISVHANRLDAVGEMCGATLGCAPSNALGQLLLLVVTGLVAVFVLAAIQRVSEARAEVAEERSRTATEQEAFERFARRVARLDPSRPAAAQVAPADGVIATATVSTHSATDRGLEAVREAYEETVMAVPHYEEEYAEPMARHIREEFGEEVATAVSGSGQLTPELKQVLVERAREAALERDQLMRRLNREAESLEAADDQFSTMTADLDEAEDSPLEEQGFEQLVDEWNRLGELESRLSRLLGERQETLESNGISTPGGGQQSLYEYLYADLDTAFPILVDGAVLADRVKTARSRVLAALTARA
jgi:hypothetical protein